jgi:hypothetical protein
MWSGISRIIFACGKDKVSKEYYGGDYNIFDINTGLISQIKIEQMKEFEEMSLAVVKKWETSLK